MGYDVRLNLRTAADANGIRVFYRIEFSMKNKWGGIALFSFIHFLSYVALAFMASSISYDIFDGIKPKTAEDRVIFALADLLAEPMASLAPKFTRYGRLGVFFGPLLLFANSLLWGGGFYAILVLLPQKYRRSKHNAPPHSRNAS